MTHKNFTQFVCPQRSKSIQKLNFDRLFSLTRDDLNVVFTEPIICDTNFVSTEANLSFVKHDFLDPNS